MDIFEKRSGVFAILKPTNRAARDAFDAVTKRKINDKSWNPTARKNIAVDDEPIQVSTYSSGAESDGGTGPSKTLRPVLKGCYTLDLDLPPSQPDKGWLIGGGRFSGSELSPEILLTERKLHDRVSSRHARLAHNFSSGALVITVSDSSAVWINGQELLDRQLLIHGRTTSLGFGDLMYTLEIRKYDVDKAYRSHLNEYKQAQGIADDDYPSVLLATPAESDLVNEKYVLKNAVGEGGTSVVYAALDRRNGNVVAVKKVRRSKNYAQSIEDERELANYLGEHPLIINLVDFIDPATDDRDRGYRAFEVDEVFLVYTPLANWTIENFVTRDMTMHDQTREKIFWQLLEGIEYLHSNFVMHRDIKPLNMAVVSIDPEQPHARLIDFGLAKKGLHSYSYNLGTRPYKAPEMWTGFEKGTIDGYDEKVDMFAFGLSMYQFLCQQPCHWDRIDKDSNEQENRSTLFEIRCCLSHSWASEELKRTIVLCTKWKPESRPSARDIIRRRLVQQSVGGTDELGGSNDGDYHNETEDSYDEIAASMKKMAFSAPGRISLGKALRGSIQENSRTPISKSSSQDPPSPIPVKAPSRVDTSSGVQACAAKTLR